MSETTYLIFSSEFNKKLISDLISKGNKVHVIPPIETARNEIIQTNLNLLKSFTEFDWLIFTDVFAVDFYIELLLENKVDLFELDDIRICAFGEAVSDRLRFSEIHADIIANSIDADSVYKLVSDYIGDSNAKPSTIILKRLNSSSELAKVMENSGFLVNEISIYRTLDSDSRQMAKVKALIAGGAIDEIVFSDPIDLIGMSTIFKSETLKSSLPGIRISVVTPSMFQMVFELGLNPEFLES